MIQLVVLLYFSYLVKGISTNTTSSDCPPLDATFRSLWSILGSCALTLLICVWHAIHFNVPSPREEWHVTLRERCVYILLTFIAPEAIVGVAINEWREARRKVRQFREKGYEWSMTHCFFAEMGGFLYGDNTIDSLKFLELCEANKIANPVITVKEIKDKSKSDAIGKAILAIQLFWFTLQVVVRGSSGLAVTLVELDTVCMAALTLLVLFFWWQKPLRPECPHIFYSPQEVEAEPQMDSTLSNAWKAEPSYLDALTDWFTCTRKIQSVTSGQESVPLVIDDKSKSSSLGLVSVSMFSSWFILGALHLAAWNFDFPTETEKIMWRAASLVLAGSALTIAVTFGLNDILSEQDMSDTAGSISVCVFFLGVLSRMLLVALMLASLRALPSSAYQTVPWITYVPHL